MTVKSKANLTLVADDAQKAIEMFDGFFSRANKRNPDPEDVKALRDLLMCRPELELWKRVSGVMSAAEAFLLQRCAPSKGLSEVWLHRLNKMRLDLGWEEATELEQMLISHAVLCFLRLGIMELQYTLSITEEHTVKAALLYEKRLSATHRRFTRACETLARVRLLARSRPSLRLVGAKDGVRARRTRSS